jgi:hypothetical protein
LLSRLWASTVVIENDAKSIVPARMSIV